MTRAGLRRARAGRAFAAAAALLLVAAAALAQSGSALTQYRRGEKLYEEGDLVSALKAFQQAYAIDPKARRGERIGMHFEDYDPAFQLGRVHARLGNFEEAERLFAQCAASGYTERSNNAEEYRRWSAVVERARAAARAQPTALPPRVTAPSAPSTATPSPAPEPTVAVRRETSPTSVAVALAPASPSPRITPPRAASPVPTPLPAAVAAAPPLEEPTPLPTGPPLSPTAPALLPSPSGRGVGGEGVDLASLLLALLALAAAAGLVLFLLLRSRRRKPQRVGEGIVPFGRYAITGLLGMGRSSFVYEARDRRGRVPVALKIRRPDRPAAETERFAREAAALERARRPGPELPLPRLLALGTKKAESGALEYLALEKLSGRSLLSLSRRGRRRLDPALSVEILREIVAALKRVRALGLAHDELAAEDVFLMEPVPTNAGNAIRLKIFGLTVAPADPARDAVALESVAAELFRGRASSWEQDEWVAEHVPATLRRVLVRARESRGASGASFDDIEKALNEVTKPPRGAGAA